MEFFKEKTLRYLEEKYPKGKITYYLDSEILVDSLGGARRTPQSDLKIDLSFSTGYFLIDFIKKSEDRLHIIFNHSTCRCSVEYSLSILTGEFSCIGTFVSRVSFKKFEKMKIKSKWIMEDIRYFGSNSLDFIMRS